MLRRGSMAVIGIVACAGFGHTWIARAQEKPKIALKDLAWMIGDWRTEVDGELLQESWLAPLGDAMCGTFRWVKKDGKTSLFEFLTITDDGGELAFRFRHFSRSLKAWEEKDAPLTFKLTRATEQEAVWENPEQKALMKMTYRREGADKLTVALESTDKDGAVGKQEYHFTRSKSGGS